jgi:Bacteriophage related domain of unknown function
MKENLIESALNAKLDTLNLPTSWENKSFDPIIDTLWIRPTFIPGQSKAAAIGVNAQDRITGIYQVDVFAPADVGVYDGGQQVSAVMTAYKRGTALIYSGVTVKITKVWRSTARPGPDWYQIPVIVEWQADVDV